MDSDSTPIKESRRKSTGSRSIASPHANPAGEVVPATSPKAKRRKVNHACLYCRRSHMTCDLERPCTRCIKRNIGHLCHDEPREPVKRSKSEHSQMASEDGVSSKPPETSPSHTGTSLDQQQVDQQLLQEDSLNTAAAQARLRQAQQPPVSSTMLNAALGTSSQAFTPYSSEWKLGGNNQFHDVHNFHPSYMFNTPEVNNEYNLLNDFLSTSLLNDGGMFPGDDTQQLFPDATSALNAASSSSASRSTQYPRTQGQQLLAPSAAAAGGNILRPASTGPADKDAQETYYLTAADPSGSDAPDARIKQLLQAKYDAGMLRPFNYVKGYARLNRYMEKNMQPLSRQKILRQLDKFRPKFRERMQSLTDLELVLVEMWFEKCLMEYDRVFASMAVPACCWRRTGEIFRGNKEMAELIHVPIESLRDGKLAIHDIIVENHLVSYWEKFGAIAFDNSQKAMLTSCSLKNPDLQSREPEIMCCFSFTIRRDSHKIPSLIVGNFLPVTKMKK